MSFIVTKDEHTPRIERFLRARIVSTLTDQQERGAGVIGRDAQDSIMEGSGGGKVSLPGEPPNNQTGALHDSMFVSPSVDDGEAVTTLVGFEAPYARYLERGTSKMYPRPFLEPASERNRGTVLLGYVLRLREMLGLI